MEHAVVWAVQAQNPDLDSVPPKSSDQSGEGHSFPPPLSLPPSELLFLILGAQPLPMLVLTNVLTLLAPLLIPGTPH